MSLGMNTMRVLALTGFLAITTWAGGPDASGRAERAATEFTGLTEALAELRGALIERYEAATPQERETLPDLSIGPIRRVAPRFVEAAKRYSGDSEAFPFWLWHVRAGHRMEDGQRPDPLDALLRYQSLAMEALLRDHIDDARQADAIAAVGESLCLGRGGKLAYAEALQAGTPHLEVRAGCLYVIARQSVDWESLTAGLERVVEAAPDSSFAEQARTDLFEIRYLRVGCEAPEMVGGLLDGGEIRLSEQRGKVVVLYFGSLQCAPCLAELPASLKRAEEHLDEPFVQIGIHTGKVQVDRLRVYCERNGVSWPIVVDQLDLGDSNFYGPIATKWNVDGTPMVYVIDAHGVVRYRFVRGEEIDDAVRVLLDEVGRGRDES